MPLTEDEKFKNIVVDMTNLVESSIRKMLSSSMIKHHIDQYIKGAVEQKLLEDTDDVSLKQMYFFTGICRAAVMSALFEINGQNISGAASTWH